MNLKSFSIPCLSLIVPLASGCSAGDAASSETIGTLDEALYFTNNTKLWNGASSDNLAPLGTAASIPVCWIEARRTSTPDDRQTCDHATATKDCTGETYNDEPEPGRPGYFTGTPTAIRDQVRNVIRSAVERTWMSSANIEFYGWNTCPKVNGVHRAQDLLGYMAVQLSSQVFPDGQTCSNHSQCSYGQFCDTSTNKCGRERSNWTNFPGKSDTTPSVIELDWKAVQLEPDMNLFNIVHEFGHALGFEHEWRRPDWTLSPDLGAPEANWPGNYLGTAENDTMSIMDYSDGIGMPPGGHLSAWDIAGVQRAYGRKYTGSLVGTWGMCANVEGASTGDGARIISFPCRGAWNDTFRRPATSFHLETMANQRCLNISGSAGPNPLIAWDCNSGVNEDFVFSNVEWRAMGNMCVHRNGSALELRACNGSGAQRWDFFTEKGNPAFRIKAAGVESCVQTASTAGEMGEQLQMASCSASVRQRFVFPGSGRIRYANNSQRCLNVSGGHPNSGSPIILWNDCGANPAFNSRFHVHGRVKSRTTTHCMEPTGRGSQVAMRYCVNGEPRQVWDYYF